MEVISHIDDKIMLLEDIIVTHFSQMDVDDRARVSGLINDSFIQYSFQTLILTHGIDELLAKLNTPECEALVETTRDILFKYAFKFNRHFNESYDISALMSPILQARNAMLGIASVEDISAGRFIEGDNIDHVALILMYIVETLTADFIEENDDGERPTRNGDA